MCVSQKFFFGGENDAVVYYSGLVVFGNFENIPILVLGGLLNVETSKPRSDILLLGNIY
jgi:hypothetical protein